MTSHRSLVQERIDDLTKVHTVLLREHEKTYRLLFAGYDARALEAALRLYNLLVITPLEPSGMDSMMLEEIKRHKGCVEIFTGAKIHLYVLHEI